ncbi:MAG: metallophosphatase domain-containing protein [Bacteroidetes bacterium]|nr:metallophosphatase domain-containing protein [Bacteroidota bacterium]
MRIILISDTHNQHHKVVLPEGDVLLHAGDISGRGTKKEVQDFLSWFSAQPHKHKVFIAGNHDFFIQQNHNEFLSMLPSNITYLEDKLVEIGGLKIYGSPWTPEFMNWAFMKPAGAEMKKQWDLIPDGIDILLTHGPAFGALDVIFSGLSVGCTELSKAIERVNPKYFVFGHIHEGHGSLIKGYTQYINASVLNENYLLIHEPIVVNI